jgi:replicative superfamily II helicase
MTLIGVKNRNHSPSLWEELFQELSASGKDKDVVQMDILCLELLQRTVTENCQTIVFVHSRGEISHFATVAARVLKDIPITREMQMRLAKRSLRAELRTALAKGIGIDYVELPGPDRIFVEDSFRTKSFLILISIATLAWGVNIPAHTVIIKDTKISNQELGGFEDIGILDVHQMFGRALRPQFEPTGMRL